MPFALRENPKSAGEIVDDLTLMLREAILEHRTLYACQIAANIAKIELKLPTAPKISFESKSPDGFPYALAWYIAGEQPPQVHVLHRLPPIDLVGKIAHESFHFHQFVTRKPRTEPEADEYERKFFVKYLARVAQLAPRLKYR